MIRRSVLRWRPGCIVRRLRRLCLGRPIRYTRPSERDYLAGLGAQGMSQDYIAVQKMIYRVVRLNISALPNHTVHRLTGTPATSFAQFVRDHHQVWSPDREGDA